MLWRWHSHSYDDGYVSIHTCVLELDAINNFNIITFLDYDLKSIRYIICSNRNLGMIASNILLRENTMLLKKSL